MFQVCRPWNRWRRRERHMACLLMLALLNLVFVCVQIDLSSELPTEGTKKKPFYPQLSRGQQRYRHISFSDDGSPRSIYLRHIIQKPSSAISIPASRYSPLTDLYSAQSYLRQFQTPKPCTSLLEMDVHYIDRDEWESISNITISEKRRALDIFLYQTLPKLTYDPDQYGYTQDRGILFVAGNHSYQRALVSIRVLRELHRCTLPIELWYMHGELSSNQLQTLITYSVKPRELISEQRKHSWLADFSVQHDYTTGRNYQVKTLAILLSSFKEVLYLDADNIPLRDPSYLFEDEAYKTMGALFWPDFWKFPIDHPMWSITGQTCEDEREQESAQMVIDKKRSWQGLLASFFFQRDHQFYFKIILGDKDTFRFGWKITDSTYHMVPHLPAVAGRVREDAFCGHTMVHFDPTGDFLFMHSSLLKNVYSRRNITWETLQYVERVDPVPLSARTDAIQNFLVDYPKMLEIRGGRQKRLSDGGNIHEDAVNPCLTYHILSQMKTETTKAVVNQWGSKLAVDSFRKVQVDFNLFQGGRFSWFEKTYYDFGGPESFSQYEAAEKKSRSLFSW